MPARPKRITVCQQAAICGLLLAGVGYVDACGIVDANRHKMHAYIPRDLRRGNLPVRVRDMTRQQFKTYRRYVATHGGDKAFARAVSA